MPQSKLSWKKIVLRYSEHERMQKFELYIRKTWGKVFLADFAIEDMWGAIVCFAFEDGIFMSLVQRTRIKTYDIHKWGCLGKKFKTPHDAMLYAAREYFKKRS